MATSTRPFELIEPGIQLVYGIVEARVVFFTRFVPYLPYLQTMKLIVLNGPNLNLLGSREPERYGSDSLASLESSLTTQFPNAQFTFFQSNHEGELIDMLQGAEEAGAVGVILNPGGFTHTSVAIRDAIAAIRTPVVEVHITNIASRETFRHVSITSGPTVGQISGFGVTGYELAVRFFMAT